MGRIGLIIRKDESNLLFGADRMTLALLAEELFVTASQAAILSQVKCRWNQPTRRAFRAYSRKCHQLGFNSPTRSWATYYDQNSRDLLGRLNHTHLVGTLERDLAWIRNGDSSEGLLSRLVKSGFSVFVKSIWAAIFEAIKKWL